jgi:hypothetical protein
MTEARIALVIPTRNRASLTVEAVRSIVDQGRDIDVFVSDNSPSPDQSLLDFVRDLGRPEIVCLRPPASLHQAAHWDWAVRQALQRSPATHFAVHYDRKIMKPNALAVLESAAQSWPDVLICWSHDYVGDVPPPVRLYQPPWTGNVFALRTARIVELTSQGRATAIYSHALPLLSNCLVPRSILTETIERFGDLCDSTTPDSCFAFRFAAQRDHYLHLDRPLGITYAAGRSAGGGYLRGNGGDWLDFRRSWGDRPWLAAAPIPGLNLGLNMLYHEYELVRRRSTGETFPPIQFDAYLNDLAVGLELIEDRESQAALRLVLKEQGWEGGTEPKPVRDFIHHILLDPLDRHFGIRLRGATGRAFSDERRALRHALARPRRPATQARHLDVLEPVRVGTLREAEAQLET